MGETRNVLRRLLRSRLFTAVSILTLALGIGANAAIFTVVRGVLLKPLPFPDPEPLVGVWHRGFSFSEGLTQSPATYFTYREENRVFEDVGMWDNTFVAVTGIAEPERVDIHIPDPQNTSSSSTAFTQTGFGHPTGRRTPHWPAGTLKPTSRLPGVR